jgi:hypothetical protein
VENRRKLKIIELLSHAQSVAMRDTLQRERVRCAKKTQDVFEHVAIAVDEIASTVVLVDIVAAAEHGLQH